MMNDLSYLLIYNRAKLLGATSGQELRTFAGRTESVFDCAVSPDGSWIVSASLDKALKTWSITNASKMHTLYGCTVCKIKAGMAIHSSTNEDLWKGR